jgi:hypothetical protein
MSHVSYASSGTPSRARLCKPALISFICGLLVCVPLITGILGVLLGILGFIAAGKPGMRGRWMAVVGLVLGILNIGGWVVVGGSSLAAWRWTSGVVATLKAPSLATHDFIRALAEGDEAKAKGLSAMSDADLASAKTMIQAQGGFVDTTFNNLSMNEGGSGHVSGTAQFKVRTLRVSADLSDGPEGWRVTSIELLP